MYSNIDVTSFTAIVRLAELTVYGLMDNKNES